MTATVAALLGLVSTDAQGFGGRKSSGSDCGDPCGSPCGPVATGACGSWVTQKQKVTEYVQQWVDQTVTVMQQQQKQETYTAYKTECVPETVTKQVTVNKMVQETVNETRCVTERVPVQKEVTVMEKVPVQKTVTVMEKRPVQKEVTVTERVPVQEDRDRDGTACRSEADHGERSSSLDRDGHGNAAEDEPPLGFYDLDRHQGPELR